MGMQETAAAAQVHSCSCGLALIEEVAVPSRVGAVLEDLNRERDAGKDRLTINSEDLWNSALIGHLVRLADGGRFQSEERCGKGQADMEVGLEDPNDELAAENLRLMKEDQKSLIEPPGANVMEAAADAEEDGLRPTGGAGTTTEATQKIGCH